MKKLFSSLSSRIGASISAVLGLALVAGAVWGQAANPPGPPAYGSTPPLASQYPAAATPVAEAGSGSTGAVVGQISAVANQTSYLCGFDVSAIGGTAAVGPVVIAGLIGTTSFTYQISSTAAGLTLARNYNPCIPASATNTAITVTTTADGSATAVDVNVHGYRQ
jgi:hypothetical protein